MLCFRRSLPYKEAGTICKKYFGRGITTVAPIKLKLDAWFQIATQLYFMFFCSAEFHESQGHHLVIAIYHTVPRNKTIHHWFKDYKRILLNSSCMFATHPIPISLAVADAGREYNMLSLPEARPGHVVVIFPSLSSQINCIINCNSKCAYQRKTLS